MSWKNKIFNDKNINKSNFYADRKLFMIDDIDIYKVLILKKAPYGKKYSFKYLIAYNNDYVNRPLCIKLLQVIGTG